ncbi:hypothetical protein KUTeg_008966, partial [Tegillarca granosa]
MPKALIVKFDNRNVGRIARQTSRISMSSYKDGVPILPTVHYANRERKNMFLQHQRSLGSTHKRHTTRSLHQYIRCFGINRNLAGTLPSKHCGIPKCPLYWKNGWIWWWII